MSSSLRAVVAVTIASATVGLTTTAVTVGTRGMAVDLSLSTVELGWVVNAYLVAAAALVLVGARLGDVIGRLRTFEAGLAVFAAASVLATIAPGFWVLLAARALQGVGAALVLPSGIELIAGFVPPGREGLGFRWRGTAYASAFAIGPLLGGVLTDWFTWRWIFALDVALVLAATVALWPLRHRHGRGGRSPTRDLVGGLLVSVLVTLVVLLAERLAVWQVASAPFVATSLVAVVVAALLWRHERRTERPLLHPSLLADRRVLGANVATVGASAGMLSLLYFFNLFAQSAATLDLGAVAVLAALAPFLVSMALCAGLAHWFGDRLGPRAPVSLGLTLMVVGFAALSTVTADTTRNQLLVPLALAGVGAGIANASLTGVAVLHLPLGRRNEAAGWISLSRFLGSAMALAVGIATFLSVAVDSAPAAGRPAPPDPALDAFDNAAAALDRDLSGPLAAASGTATAARFAATMTVSAVALAGIAVVSWWLLRPVARRIEPGEDPSQQR